MVSALQWVGGKGSGGTGEEALEMVGLDYSALKDHSPFELSGAKAPGGNCRRPGNEACSAYPR